MVISRRYVYQPVPLMRGLRASSPFPFLKFAKAGSNPDDGALFP